jgi:chromatin assembly factor 1 subunit B
MDLPLRRPSSNSPAPPDFGHRSFLNPDGFRPGSPAPSMPGTPQSLAPFSMNPPLHAPSSRRSSFGAGSPRIHRSQSPAPAMPLPAVMPSASPLVGMTKTSNIYASEALASFFRRLTFAPDGSLLFTPAGQYKNVVPATDAGRATEDVTNTVYIYSRGGLNKPPIAHLPGHKKPSVAVRCCGTFFNLRSSIPTKNITFDTSNVMADEILPLPEPVIPSKLPASASSMEPPATKESGFAAPATPKAQDGDVTGPPAGPPSAFALPYRIVYAVATQDAVYVYDTQQTTPLCIVSNLHFATFTDLAWYV